jgi:hypothetical protein
VAASEPLWHSREKGWAQTMQFRRSERVRLLPVVSLVTIGVAALLLRVKTNPGGGVVLYGIFLFGYSILAVVNWTRRLVIDDQSIQLFGYLGGPITILKSKVISCHFRRFRANAHGSPDVMFLEINGNPGGEVLVCRYGWGPKRQELFRQLGKWLDESQCTVDEGARRMLAKAV